MKYRDHTEILPLLEGAGESWAYVKDDDRDELRTTLAGGVLKCMLASLADDRPLLRHPRYLQHYRLQPRQDSGGIEAQSPSNQPTTHALSNTANR